ncbi:MAG: D-alanine--D-alanine ligase [Candidatus Daviesbacteria bacterium]
MKVLLISGGNSSERKISLISAGEVKKALQKSGFEVKLFDLRKGLKSLKQAAKNFDVIFPVLHGEEGEGGVLQEFLAQQNIPYVGGNPEGFKKGWHKIPFKKFCDQNNIFTAQWKKIRVGDEVGKFELPSVLKSSNGGSSLEVVILKSEEDLKSSAYKELLHSGLPLFIERYLPGIEVTVGILGDQALPVIEIVPPEGKWFDYENKYQGTTQEIINAPSLDQKTQKKVQEIALDIHQKLDLGPYSRIDFIVSDNIPYVLEINTIPGFTPESLFPKAAKAIGLNFELLAKKLVELSLKN